MDAATLNFIAELGISMSVYVGNLSYEVKRQDLDDVFGEYGRVTRISMPMDREMDRPRGFAFIDMASPDQEEAVIEALDGATWLGRTMKVNQARPRNSEPVSSPASSGNYRRTSFA
ncbi:MAG: RNA recognition motif domain-containing protein [Leptolyngbyaceae cyanobacterium]